METRRHEWRRLAHARADDRRDDERMVSAQAMGACLTTGLDASSGEYAGAERGLKVVAPDRPIQVENLARKIEPGDQLALHRATVDLGERDASGCHLGLGEAAASSNRNLGGFR